jgi:tetratricopeptide (TPR) repeat protein
MNGPVDTFNEGAGSQDRNSALVKTAWDKYRSGDPQGALALLHDALKLNPESLPLHLELAKMYDSQLNSEKTIEHCAKAVKLSPNHSLAFALMGAAYTRRRQGDKAVSLLLKALAEDADNEYAYELLGRLTLDALLSLGDNLRQFFAASISVFGGPTVGVGQLQSGIQYYERGCKENWQYLRVYYRMGMLYYHADNPKGLGERIATAARSGYQPAQEWFRELNPSGQIEAFMDRCLNWAQKEEPETRDAFSIPVVAAASILGSGRGTEEHVLLAEKLMLMYPDLDMPYYWLSHHYLLRKDFQRARDVLNQGLERSKRKRNLCNEYGFLEEEAGCLAEAVQWWLRGAVIQLTCGMPSSYEPFMSLGYVAHLCGEKALSRRLLAIADSVRNIRLDEKGEQHMIHIYRAADPETIAVAMRAFGERYCKA